VAHVGQEAFLRLGGVGAFFGFDLGGDVAFAQQHAGHPGDGIDHGACVEVMPALALGGAHARQLRQHLAGQHGLQDLRTVRLIDEAVAEAELGLTVGGES
jgi:hypothetical protein